MNIEFAKKVEEQAIERGRSHDLWTGRAFDEILQMLSSQEFRDWYTSGNFAKYIEGAEDVPLEITLVDDLLKMMPR